MTIPFVEAKLETKAIIVHGSFACIKDITLQPETYNFKCAYGYNQGKII